MLSSLSIITLLATVSLTATEVSAHPQILSPRGAAPGGRLNAIYWGQNGKTKTALQNEDLTTYCKPNSGIDIIILAFLFAFGKGSDYTLPGGEIGWHCVIGKDGNPDSTENCKAVMAGIEACQANNIKVLLSIGGAGTDTSKYSLANEDEGKKIGQQLWDAYGGGNPKDKNVPRPFGKLAVDGWDFNIESKNGHEFYAALINTLRSNFQSDPAKTYYISGAPMCNDVEMAGIITDAPFDYIWVQFYNDSNCVDAKAKESYERWKAILKNDSNKSKSAKLFLGLTAHPTATTDPVYYREPKALTALVGQFPADKYPEFGGTMLWSAGYSDFNKFDNCNYAQIAHRILNPTSDTACAAQSTMTQDKSSGQATRGSSSSSGSSSSPSGSTDSQAQQKLLPDKPT